MPKGMLRGVEGCSGLFGFTPSLSFGSKTPKVTDQMWLANTNECRPKPWWIHMPWWVYMCSVGFADFCRFGRSSIDHEVEQ